jgi:AraC-like DNA-binding protein
MTPGHLTTVVCRRLLTDTDLPIQEATRRVGVADPGYFSRLFRRTHGTSPPPGALSPADNGIVGEASVVL